MPVLATQQSCSVYKVSHLKYWQKSRRDRRSGLHSGGKHLLLPASLDSHRRGIGPDTAPIRLVSQACHGRWINLPTELWAGVRRRRPLAATSTAVVQALIY